MPARPRTLINIWSLKINMPHPNLSRTALVHRIRLSCGLGLLAILSAGLNPALTPAASASSPDADTPSLGELSRTDCLADGSSADPSIQARCKLKAEELRKVQTAENALIYDGHWIIGEILARQKAADQAPEPEKSRLINSTFKLWGLKAEGWVNQELGKQLERDLAPVSMAAAAKVNESDQDLKESYDNVLAAQVNLDHSLTNEVLQDKARGDTPYAPFPPASSTSTAGLNN